MIEKLCNSRGWQFLLIVVFVLVLPLLVDINGRLGIIRRMRQEEGRLEKELAEAQAEHQALKTQLEFVADAAYLEGWARVEARMTRPGEVAIIPLTTEPLDQEEALVKDASLSNGTDLSIPEQWHNLFFDNAP